MRYRIKNWREYQHYKGRCPPWIKFHSHTFISRDWTMLADACKLSMLVCMVVASMDKEGDGSFDGDPEYLKRVAYLDTAPDLAPLVESGFLVVASDCKQLQAKDISSPLLCSSLALPLPLEGGVGETDHGEVSKPEDFVGPVPESSSVYPDPLEDFEEPVRVEARKFWSLFCGQHHGKVILRNLHSDATHKELRHFAKAITAHSETAKSRLEEYYKSPPKADKSLAAWQVIMKLGLNVTVEPKNREPPWETAKRQKEEDGRKKLHDTIDKLFKVPE